MAPTYASQRRTGQTLAEFAITLPILLLLLFGIIEFGRIFQAWVTLQNAARAAARYATTGQYETDQYDLNLEVRSYDAAHPELNSDPNSIVPCIMLGDPNFDGPLAYSISDNSAPAVAERLAHAQFQRGAAMPNFGVMPIQIDPNGDNNDADKVEIYWGGPESLYATWNGGDDCDPTDPEDQNRRRDMARILSIIDEARRGAAGLSLGASSWPDAAMGASYTDTTWRTVPWYQVWYRPLPGVGERWQLEGSNQPQWFDVMVCSAQRTMLDENNIQAAPVSPSTDRITTSVRFATHIEGDNRSPWCELLEYAPDSPASDSNRDAGWTQNQNRPWLDAGGPGDTIHIVVTFNHPLITPLGIARYIPLQARRTAVNETFRAPRAVPLVAAIPGGPNSTPTFTETYTNTFTHTHTHTATSTDTATSTFTHTATSTATETSTFTATFTASNTHTATNTATATETFTPTSTFTPTPTLSDPIVLEITATCDDKGHITVRITNTGYPMPTGSSFRWRIRQNGSNLTSITVNNPLDTGEVYTYTTTGQYEGDLVVRIDRVYNVPAWIPVNPAPPISAAVYCVPPTGTNTHTPTTTYTASSTFTATNTPTNTPTRTNTNTPTITNTPTNTLTPSNSPTASNTYTHTPTPTETVLQLTLSGTCASGSAVFTIGNVGPTIPASVVISWRVYDDGSQFSSGTRTGTIPPNRTVGSSVTGGHYGSIRLSIWQVTGIPANYRLSTALPLDATVNCPVPPTATHTSTHTPTNTPSNTATHTATPTTTFIQLTLSGTCAGGNAVFTIGRTGPSVPGSTVMSWRAYDDGSQFSQGSTNGPIPNDKTVSLAGGYYGNIRLSIWQVSGLPPYYANNTSLPLEATVNCPEPPPPTSTNTATHTATPSHSPTATRTNTSTPRPTAGGGCGGGSCKPQ